MGDNLYLEQPTRPTTPAGAPRFDAPAGAPPLEVVPLPPAFVLYAPRRRRVLPALVLAGLFLACAAVVVTASVLAARGEHLQSAGPTAAAAVTAVPAADPTPTAAVPAPAPSATPLPAPLESGLTCKELAGRGLPYGAVVDYWYAEAEAERLDPDDDGMPCASVYPDSEVAAYFSD